jgi:DNA-binding GntR family transcriptional regulator
MEGTIRHPTLGEKAYAKIRDLILSGRIRPGERLQYGRLVTELGVSQTPIKEAFTRLENEGYVVTVRRKGTFARTFTPLEIREAFEIREMLEALAARRACAHRSGDGIAAMTAISRRFARAARRRDVRACTREDYAFHETLIAMSGNGKLRELMGKTNFQLLSIGQSSPRFLQIAGEYSAMHERIIRAIGDRDEKAAERLIRAHVRYGMREILNAASGNKK